jgi:hypothetical protein
MLLLIEWHFSWGAQLLSVVLCSLLYYCTFNPKLITSAPEQEVEHGAYHHHFIIRKKGKYGNFPLKVERSKL